MNTEVFNEQWTVLRDPSPEQIAEDADSFLRQLAGPSEIWISGQDSQRTRVIVTLLHGNEPSGFRALHRLLRRGLKPPTNLLWLLGSVQAALLEPGFRHRYFPGTRDMNRCFRAPYDDPPGRIAEQILKRIRECAPEAVLDLHNTSGASPSFAVATIEDRCHEALAGLFTERLVITDLHLGALMEISSQECRVITIECGGAQEMASDETALRGLERFIAEPAPCQPEGALDLDLYHHPVRMQLESSLSVAFAPAPVLGADLTLLNSVDRYNFTTVEGGAHLGWVRDAAVRHRITLVNARGQDKFDEFFALNGNQLVTTRPLKLFMITTRPDIALSDCLLYAALESEHQRIHLDRGEQGDGTESG